MARAPKGRPGGPGRGETADRVCGALQVFQAQDGYRFGMEALFLCGFVESKALRALDLGTGSGVIPLVLLWSGKVERAVGIEIQEAMCDRARRSALANGLADRFSVIQGDVRRIGGDFPEGSFDLVTANPPFARAGEGRSCRDEERAVAREERNGALADFLNAARRKLSFRGRLVLVFPPRRLEDVLVGCRRSGLSPTRLRFVHPRPHLVPRHALLEARRGTRSALQVEAPFFIEDEKGQPTAEHLRWMFPAGAPGGGGISSAGGGNGVREVRGPSPG